MMGHREEIKTGDEKDVFDKRTKRWASRKRGFRSAVKRGFNRRVRKEIKFELRKYDIERYHHHDDFIEYGEPKPRGWWTG